MNSMQKVQSLAKSIKQFVHRHKPWKLILTLSSVCSDKEINQQLQLCNFKEGKKIVKCPNSLVIAIPYIIRTLLHIPLTVTMLTAEQLTLNRLTLSKQTTSAACTSGLFHCNSETASPSIEVYRLWPPPLTILRYPNTLWWCTVQSDRITSASMLKCKLFTEAFWVCSRTTLPKLTEKSID